MLAEQPKAGILKESSGLVVIQQSIQRRMQIGLRCATFPPCRQAADTLLDAAKRRAYDDELVEAAVAERRAEAAQHAASSGRGMAQPPASLDEFPPWCFDSKGRPTDFLFLRCGCGLEDWNICVMVVQYLLVFRLAATSALRLL